MDSLIQAIEIEAKENFGYKEQEITWEEQYTEDVPKKFAAISYKDYKKIIKKKGTTRIGNKKKNFELSEAQKTALITFHFTDNKFKDLIKEKAGIKRLVVKE